MVYRRKRRSEDFAEVREGYSYSSMTQVDTHDARRVISTIHSEQANQSLLSMLPIP